MVPSCKLIYRMTMVATIKQMEKTMNLKQIKLIKAMLSLLTLC